MQHIPYLRATITEETRKILGDSLFAEFLCLGYQANELMVFQQLVVVCLPNEYPDSTPFHGKAKINANVAIRSLCERLYDASNTAANIGNCNHWAKNRKDLFNSFLQKMGSLKSEIVDQRKTNNFKLLKRIRDKSIAHLRPEEVQKRLRKTHVEASNSLYFFDNYLNSFFPAAEDLVFGSLLHEDFGDLHGSAANQAKYTEWLYWLIEFTTMTNRFFHNFCVWISDDLGGFSLEEVNVAIDDKFVGRLETVKLPVFLTGASPLWGS